MDDYLSKLTKMVEELHYAGVAIDDGEFVLITLGGFHPR